MGAMRDIGQGQTKEFALATRGFLRSARRSDRKTNAIGLKSAPITRHGGHPLNTTGTRFAGRSAFRAARWLPGGHLQTLWPALFRRRVPLDVRRERLELPDGDFLDLDWVGRGNGPIVIVLHGLQGSIRSPYARGLLRAVERRGWRGVLMHFRGCGGELNRLKRAYHCGETSDLDHVVREVRRREPGTPVTAVGYSLGGSVLLKWLGEWGERAPLDAATAVSVPYDLAACADHINRGFARLYQWRLVASMRQALREKMQRMPLGLPLKHADVAKLRTFRQFDHCVTAPLHGFHSGADYYERTSSRPWLTRITVPTLLIHAADDPFMPPHTVPTDADVADAVRIELCHSGGHLGFVGARGGAPRYWLEERIPRYLARRIETAPASTKTVSPRKSAQREERRETFAGIRTVSV